jgi:hypothetical protein
MKSEGRSTVVRGARIPKRVWDEFMRASERLDIGPGTLMREALEHYAKYFLPEMDRVGK